MGGRILNDSPCSKTSPTEGLNLSPSPSIHLALSLAEMQLIRIERAKCAEIERAGCALAHAGGRTVSHSPEQIQIWGLSVQHVVTKLHLIISTLSLGVFQLALNPSAALTEEKEEEEEKKSPIPPALLQ